MKHIYRAGVCLMMAGGLGACSQVDRVVFVTQTRLGVGATPSSGDAHAGYDRTEAYIGPDYPAYGALPPVAASLQSDQAFLAPSVNQAYATGDAALIVTKRIAVPVAPPAGTLSDRDKCILNQGCKWSSDNDRRLAIVATNTHVGLVLKGEGSGLPAVDFGYGRQEASMIPLRASKSDGGDIYPSVLAAIQVSTDSGGGTAGSGGMKASQFIATGGAADMLAAKPEVQNLFGQIASASAQKSLQGVLGLSDAEMQAQAAQAKAGAVKATADADAYVQKLLGVAPDQDRALTDDDQKKIAAAVAALPGDAADPTTARGRAQAYLTGLTTVKDVRDRLSFNPATLADLTKPAT